VADSVKVQLCTSAGDIVIELDPVKAPKTTENFLGYVRSGYYDGTIFHRVIENFMIQAGGFETEMKSKQAGANIENEADNGLRNALGTIAMARTSDPHSASAQFFINAGDNAFLDFKSRSSDGWGYCVFGAVVEGMEIVGKIVKSSTTSRAGHEDVPAEEIVIERAHELDDS
jgi:peptidyl-prolyl cis-trans isomerase B (cyclophilin B)